MGNQSSKNLDTSSNIGNLVEDDIKSEDIHKILLSVYSKLTNTKNDFETRKEILQHMYNKYQKYINPIFPCIYQFTKTCFEYEMFVFIGTIGTYAIDMIVYYDLFDWIVLSNRTNFRSHSSVGGGNKLQYCVSKRKTHLSESDIKHLENKKREVETIISTGCTEFTDTLADDSKKSSCKILQPEDGQRVDCVFIMKLEFSNWKMPDKNNHYKVFIDGDECATISNYDPISVNLHGYKRGPHKIIVKLYDSKEQIKGSVTRKVWLKLDCPHIKKSNIETSESQKETTETNSCQSDTQTQSYDVSHDTSVFDTKSFETVSLTTTDSDTEIPVSVVMMSPSDSSSSSSDQESQIINTIKSKPKLKKIKPQFKFKNTKHNDKHKSKSKLAKKAPKSKSIKFNPNVEESINSENDTDNFRSDKELDLRKLGIIASSDEDEYDYDSSAYSPSQTQSQNSQTHTSQSQTSQTQTSQSSEDEYQTSENDSVIPNKYVKFEKNKDNRQHDVKKYKKANKY